MDAAAFYFERGGAELAGWRWWFTFQKLIINFEVGLSRGPLEGRWVSFG